METLKSVIVCVLQPAVMRILATGTLEPKSSHNFERGLETTVKGRYNALRHSASVLAESTEKNRSIIGLSSIFAEDGQKGHIAYSAYLGALNSMLLPAARDLSQFGIRVNNILVGFFESEKGLGSQPVALKEGICNMIPTPKRLGQYKDFSHTVKYMIENEYLNAVNLRLDGAVRSFP